MHILPNTNNVTIQKEKFTDYILDPIKSRGKWIAFRDALGYTKSNVDLLIQNIYEQLLNYPAEYKGDKGYGKTYAVHLILTGENGKTAYVVTAWLDDLKTGEMRLISAYVKKKRNEQGKIQIL